MEGRDHVFILCLHGSRSLALKGTADVSWIQADDIRNPKGSCVENGNYPL